MDYNQLRDKTVFDFCSDRRKIAEFIPSATDAHFDLDAYRAFCKANPTNNALHLTLLANVLADNHLALAVREEFSAELKAFFSAQ